MKMLAGYSTLLEPWARSVARYMLADVGRRDYKIWKANSKAMGIALRAELTQAPTGIVFRQLQDEQVVLITSIPTVAAERVHKLTQAGLVDSRRADEIAQEILNSGKVTEARARLIARTEVARTASNFTQARARFAGSEAYIWHTSGDARVRDTHAAMNGKVVRWDTPPKTDIHLDPYHAGCGPNCRCYPEPIFPN